MGDFNNNRIKLFSWIDIERWLKMNFKVWESAFTFDASPSNIMIYPINNNPVNIIQILFELFTNNFNIKNIDIHLDIGNISIPVIINYETESFYAHDNIAPLFKDVFYRDSSYPQIEANTFECPVIAFHSYKGGVGRSLALLAFAKAWSTVFDDINRNKLLIIDADIDAPGLSWMVKNDFGETGDILSYLDLLALIQDYDEIDRIVDMACTKLGRLTVSIDTRLRSIEQVFMPVYRYKNQFLDIYANPETVTYGLNKEYILAQVLSKIGNKIGAAAVLVDLRAGVSEYSSTLLFDSRVKKYLVTSTSMQSVKGTGLILDLLTKGLNISSDKTIIPEIFINMITENANVEEIKNELSSYFYKDDASQDSIYDVITEFKHNEGLIHFSSIRQIMPPLSESSMYINLYKLIKSDYIASDTKNDNDSFIKDRDNVIGLINEIASQQITAEKQIMADGYREYDVLITASIKQMITQFSNSIPSIVIMGAKGSGKTFLYHKFAKAMTWKSFCNDTSDERYADTCFLPVIATRSVITLNEALANCINNLNSHIADASVKKDCYISNERGLSEFNIKDHNEIEWLNFWEIMMVTSFNPNIKTFEAMNDILEKNNKRVIFLFDGIEEHLQNITNSKTEKLAITALCQKIVTSLSIQYPQIGIILFLRRDMAQDAITVNYTQFKQLYEKFELRWSALEAQRLVVWLVNQASKDFYNGPVDLDEASLEAISPHLNKLWGLKLGKPNSREAYSSRWILAALSDLNGQLQARDIIRFLRDATANVSDKTYNDRILMPNDIIYAVRSCSIEKIDEIKQEIIALKPIFEKLDKISANDKRLPFTKETIILEPQEEQLLIQHGFLAIEGDKYYLPEIIRQSLGYKYEKGARPKVLSLLLKQY